LKKFSKLGFEYVPVRRPIEFSIDFCSPFFQELYEETDKSFLLKLYKNKKIGGIGANNTLFFLYKPDETDWLEILKICKKLEDSHWLEGILDATLIYLFPEKFKLDEILSHCVSS
jgi:hypothetical protein